ncbi:hypothetical protein C8R46DRAFT_906938 [Mycena filopes]|nr:hypothetical protein C8R46DRAFT_906938 [Mycena filopes]
MLFTLSLTARQQMDDARHLAKYVFARQYGLASPFKFQTSKYASFRIPNFNDREDEIKVIFPCGTTKTPKRLKEVIQILEKLLWRHGKCGYKPLRDHACPSKVISVCSFASTASCRSLSIRSKRSGGRTSTAAVSLCAVFPSHPRSSHDGGNRNLFQNIRPRRRARRNLSRRTRFRSTPRATPSCLPGSRRRRCTRRRSRALSSTRAVILRCPIILLDGGGSN